MSAFPPLTDRPPRFRRVNIGVYETPDGRLQCRRLEERPPAWNVEWTIDYGNHLADLDRGDSGYGALAYSTPVDGAASKRDALAILAAEWPALHRRMALVEARGEVE